MRKLSEDMEKFMEMLTHEKKIREDTEKTMVKMIEDVHGRITSDLMLERRERETTEETLLKLLEETCTRVENSLHIR